MGMSCQFKLVPRTDSLKISAQRLLILPLQKQNELNEDWIAKRFHLALMNFYSFTSLTPFLLTVRAGISAIKTP